MLMPFTSAILKIFSLMLRGTYTLCATVLSNGFLAWLIVFYSGGLFSLNFLVELDKCMANIIRNPFASTTMQEVVNQTLGTANFSPKLLLSVSIINQLRNNQTPIHNTPQLIAFALCYRFCVIKSIKLATSSRF